MLKRFHCVPETTTFSALAVGDIFQYVPGIAEFVKGNKHYAKCIDPLSTMFFEVPNRQVVRVGYYHSEPDGPNAALPCAAASDSETPR